MFRIVKNDNLPRWKAVIFRICAILFGFVLSGIVIAALGFPVIDTFRFMFAGAFGSEILIQNTISFAIPLAITALGLSVAFRMRFWNIGGEGQMIFGAIAATFVSLQMPDDTSGYILIPLMLLAGMVGGAIWGIIPGIFRVYFHSNETLFTLMMNYIAICLVNYLYNDVWKDSAKHGFSGIKAIEAQAHLPKLFGIQIGFLIALALAGALYLMINKTKFGYEIRVVGESEPTANYAGMNVKWIMLLGILLSGGIVGLAGAVQLNGSAFALADGITGGAGFTAIVIAWLSNLSAPIIIVVAILFGALKTGATAIQMYPGVPSSVGSVMQGLLLFSVIGGEFFLKYRIVFSGKAAHFFRRKEVISSEDGEKFISDDWNHPNSREESSEQEGEK